MEKILELGSVLINVIVRNKFSGDIQENFIDAVSALKEIGVDVWEARNINREFEKIGDRIASSCGKILESSSLEHERYSAIIENILLAYKNLALTNQNY